MATAAETDTLRLVMVGMTGTGKSSLGNSILAIGWLLLHRVWDIAKRPFFSQQSPESVTVSCKTQSTTVLGRKIKVVDTPGFIDTKKSKDKLVKEIAQCVMEVKPGPHAILLVVAVGRFTKDVVEAIDMMKYIFGDKSIDFLIIVFTHTDSLDEGQTLENFIEKIGDSPKQLLRDCKNRYVGFNNRCKPKSDENQEQVQKLLRLVEKIKKDNGGSHYKHEMLTSSFDRICRDIKKKLSGCFASDSKVRVQDVEGAARVKALQDLVVGDIVQTYDHKTNSLTYSPVYFITYQDIEQKSILRELFYEGIDGKDHSVRLQGKHLVYASCGPLPALKADVPPSTPVMSEKVNVGDILWVADDVTGELIPRRVLKINAIVANVRHPMTMNHTIVVDGVLASVHMHNEWLLRLATAPLRLLYKISPRLSDFWLSKKAVHAWDYVEHYLL